MADTHGDKERDQQITRALTARQDAADAAARLAEDGFEHAAHTILKALSMLDSTVIMLERELAHAKDSDGLVASMAGPCCAHGCRFDVAQALLDRAKERGELSEAERLSARSAGTRIEPHKDCPWQNCLDSGRCRHPDDCDGAGWWKALDHSKLKIGAPCYRCGKVISAPLSHICEKPRAPRSAIKPISTVPLIRRIQKQRDECAEALRALVAVVESNFPMPAGVHPGSPLDRARKALADVPTYEQQLRNIAEGIGMTYEELVAGIDRATSNPSDSRANLSKEKT